MSDLLYKYRGMQNFRFFLDILLYNRLYAAKFSELNDPMEGQYKGEISEKIANTLATKKGNCRICSLSSRNDSELMWSHYSEGHRGVAIGLKVDPIYRVDEITYTGLHYITEDNSTLYDHEKILLHKLEYWSYENEKRVLTYEPFIKVKIEEVITGRWMTENDFNFISDLIRKINPLIKLTKAESYMNPIKKIKM